MKLSLQTKKPAFKPTFSCNAIPCFISILYQGEVFKEKKIKMQIVSVLTLWRKAVFIILPFFKFISLRKKTKTIPFYLTKTLTS